jgi:EAL domain-containing protein (putative c-di-GMP-specific phosphodiesterase class I)
LTRLGRLEVDLSAHSVTDNALITERLTATNADPRGLCLELTETAAIINVDRARDFARQLSDLGCEFALDDFRAGFASFYYIKHLHFDYLKIDGEFIKDLHPVTPTK